MVDEDDIQNIADTAERVMKESRPSEKGKPIQMDLNRSVGKKLHRIRIISQEEDHESGYKILCVYGINQKSYISDTEDWEYLGMHDVVRIDDITIDSGVSGSEVEIATPGDSFEITMNNQLYTFEIKTVKPEEDPKERDNDVFDRIADTTAMDMHFDKGD